MRPSASVRTWACRGSCLLAALLAAPARGDDPPPLAAPAGSTAPDASSAPSPIPSQPPAAPAQAVATPIPPARTDHPVLALPGVTMRPTRPAPAVTPLPPSLASTPDGGLPALAPPSGTPAGRSVDASPLPSLPSSRFRGRVIESTPSDDALPAIDVPRPGVSAPRGAGIPSVGPRRGGEPLRLEEIDERDFPGMDRPKRSDAEVEKEKLRDLPSSLPARRGFLGGRWVNPFLGRPPMDDSRSDIRAEPRTDPAADAMLKRRVEKQAVNAVGDRVRSVEVHVVGRSITIQARGVKIFQRRAVRRDLERLPGISGYRSVVELVD